VVGRSRQHRGWASSRKREEPTPGSSRTDGARLAACHRFHKGESVARQKRKEVEASVPARIKSSGLVARTSYVQLQKSVGDVWSRIGSANALQKERSGSSERGPSSSLSSAGETVGGGLAQKDDSRVGLTAKTGRTGTRPRVARDRHPAVATSSQAVVRSRDRGCNGHRILRRVPTDGRHPGSSRSVGFHETT